MDLTIHLNEYKLNIRVAVLMQTEKGYVFEVSKAGFKYLVGGRVKLNESTEQAARREIMEEVGAEVNDLHLVAVLENFFPDTANNMVHEFCFVYHVPQIIKVTLPENFYEIPAESFSEHTIQPQILQKIVADGISDTVAHYVTRS